jgi:hypothetical protein
MASQEPSPLLSLNRRTISRPKSPASLAAAFTILEGEAYDRLLPSDYILYLLHPATKNRMTALHATNKKIGYWVQLSILDPNEFNVRADVFKFFINTAVVRLVYL